MRHFLPKTKQPRGPARPIPSFHAVPVRIRSDGWTPLKQAEFIGHLAETRSVAKAARAVGMRRETAYRLRSRPGAEGFNAAWDAAMARLESRAGWAQWRAARDVAIEALKPHRKVTLAHLQWRMETGIWRVILHGGRYRGVHRKVDNSAVFAVLGRVRDPEISGVW